MWQEKLLPKYRVSRYPLPQNIVTTRNRSIILSYMELFLDLGSLYFYIRRRGGIVLFITILNFVFWYIGLWSTMKLHYYGLMAHAVYSISIVGGFYIYIIIDGLIVSSNDIEMANQDDGQLS